MITKTYCCGVDYQHEPPEDINWFSTPELLKEKQPCWNECGIIEITLNEKAEEVGLQWIVPQKILNN